MIDACKSCVLSKLLSTSNTKEDTQTQYMQTYLFGLTANFLETFVMLEVCEFFIFFLGGGIKNFKLWC